MIWFKGVTHTHARPGETDTTVQAAAMWYKERGYRFLVITDHDTVVFPAAFTEMEDSSFLPIPGEEITAIGGGIDVEISGLNIRKSVPRVTGESVPAALSRSIALVREQGGVPVYNHPNYQWRLGAMDIAAVEDCRLFELFVGFPGVNNEGDSLHPGMEQAWDSLLTAGKRLYAVASDDAHVYRRLSADLPNPGRGWVAVLARRLDAAEILSNLDRGLFYSSTGVVIERLRVSSRRIEITVRDAGDSRFVTEFIGPAGRVLKRTADNPAAYTLSGPETYVRARITDEQGRRAWIQPVFVNR
ncbi:MAG: hypothetical protein QUS35_05915 [bacterium]|nr:hypothetical protein [bacterium]